MENFFFLFNDFSPSPPPYSSLFLAPFRPHPATSVTHLDRRAARDCLTILSVLCPHLRGSLSATVSGERHPKGCETAEGNREPREMVE